MKRSALLGLALGLLCALSVTGLTQAATPATPELERLLPADTLVAVYVPSVPDLLEKWDASPFYRFYGDPRSAAFFRPLREKVEGLKQRMSAEQGVSSDRFWSFFSGGLVMAGLPTPKGSKEPIEWVLIFEHNGDEQIIGKLKQPISPKGSLQVRVSQDRHAGLAYRRVTLIKEVKADLPSKNVEKKKKKKKDRLNGFALDGLAGGAGEDEAKSGPDLSLNLPTAPGAVQVKQQVVEEYHDYFGPSIIVHAGSKGRPIERVLGRIAKPGAADTLAASTDFKSLTQAIGGRGEIVAWANTAALGRTFDAEAMEDRSPLSDMTQLRLQEFRAAAGRLSLQTGRAQLDLAVSAPEPRQGVSRLLFLPQSAPPQAARLVPSDALAYWSSSYPLRQVWPLAMEMLMRVSPPTFLLVDSQVKGFEQQTGLSLERDLLGQLEPRVVRFLTLERGGRKPLEMTTTMVGVRDAKALRPAIQTTLEYVSRLYQTFHLETAKAGPWPLWVIREGRPDVAATAQTAPAFYVCLADEWLLLGGSRKGIEDAVARMQGQAKGSLAELDSFQRMAKELPADRFSEIFLNTGEISRLAELGLLPPGGKKGKKKKEDWSPVNAKMMPPKAVWGEFFGPLANSATREGDVIKMQTLMLYQ